MVFIKKTTATVLALVVGAAAYRPSTYPEYCSESGSTDEINGADRQIPALSASEADLVDELIQVQVMIRHGARTPYDALECWNGYDVVWNDCNVTELMLPSESDSGLVPDAPWLFRKLYDASPDKLDGNCYTGQLIPEGYYQENELGKQFKETYVGIDDAPNGRFKLFADNAWENIDTSQVYFRSTDLQRTLMSGQQFAYNFFSVTNETIVDWHTGDNSLDPLAPSTGSCPYLEQIEKNAFASDTFIQDNATNSALLEPDLNAEFGEGQWFWSSVTDCFMTTVCTEREIPDAAGKMNDELFNGSVQQSQSSYFWKMGWNESEWAKLGMSDTLYKVRENAAAAMADVTDGDNDGTSHYKLVLLSAHDTSVIPYVDALLGSNGPKDLWAPYASYVTLELYKAAAEGGGDAPSHYFRAIYNGEPLHLNGCPTLSTGEPGLCSADIVMDATLGYAQENGGPQCQQPVSSSDERDDNPDPDRTDGGDDDFSMGLSMGGFVGVVAISVLFGGLLAGMLFKYTSLTDMCPGLLGMKGTDYETYKSQQAALSSSQGEYGSNNTLTTGEASNPLYTPSPSGSRRSEL